MWQLFGDQFNRNRSVAITFVPLLSPLLPLLGTQQKGILYFFFFWNLLLGGFLGGRQHDGRQQGAVKAGSGLAW